MRSTAAALSAMLAITTGALIAGCSGGSSNPSLSIPSAPASSQSLHLDTRAQVDASGHLKKDAALLRFLRPLGRPIPLGRPRADYGNVYISDTSGGVKVLENTVYTPKGSITSGATTPDGEWTDVNKNLYVANFDLSVVEYACRVNKCGSFPTFTYNSGLHDPINVTTDRAGNVFIADYQESNSQGAVNEYAQGSNTVLQHCVLPGPVNGVAVDSHSGNVFVAYSSPTSINGYIDEFKGGLAGCNGTLLKAPIDLPGDLILDNHNNIIVCDQWNALVDVIAPPYSSISSTIGSGWVDPFQPAIENHNGAMLLYVEDSSAGPSSSGWVQVFNYPAGTLVATLSGSAYNLNDPYGVTDTFNLVR